MSYDGGVTHAVHDVGLSVEEGTLLILLGESGCGKTTTLKMINHLTELSAGRITVAGQDIQCVDPVQLRRQISYVFQGIGLFPHLTVAQNVAAVPQLLGWSAKETKAQIHALLRLGGDYEFFGRPEWRELASRYGLKFCSLVTMDSTLMYSAVATGDVDVITAFSTDGRISAFDLLLLEDTRHAFPPYDALLLIAPTATARMPAFLPALDSLADTIDAEAMRLANQHVDVEGGTVKAAAQVLWR